MLIILVLLAVPIYLVWRWIFSKKISSSRTNVFVSICTTIITLFIFYFGFIFLLTFGVRDKNLSTKFDSTKWFEEENDRIFMADDIVNSKVFLGKDTSHVRHVLGASDQSTDSSIVYSLGISGGLSMMYHELVIKHEKGKVSSVIHIETPE